MWRKEKSGMPEIKQDEWEVADDVRKAERELHTALWQFNEALGQDHVDYAIYSLEAAEKKLDMLLRKAKVQYGGAPQNRENRVRMG